MPVVFEMSTDQKVVREGSFPDKLQERTVASLPVSVTWVAMAKQHWLPGFNDGNVFSLFSHMSGGQKSKIKVAGCLVPGENPLSGLQVTDHALLTSRGRGRRGAAALPSSHRTLIPSDQTPILPLHLI